MKYLVASEAGTSKLHTGEHGKSPVVELGWGMYWTIVEADSPVRAGEEALPTSGEVLVIPLEAGNFHKFSVATNLIEEGER